MKVDAKFRAGEMIVVVRAMPRCEKKKRRLAALGVWMAIAYIGLGKSKDKGSRECLTNVDFLNDTRPLHLSSYSYIPGPEPHVYRTRQLL